MKIKQFRLTHTQGILSEYIIDNAISSKLERIAAIAQLQVKHL